MGPKKRTKAKATKGKEKDKVEDGHEDGDKETKEKHLDFKISDDGERGSPVRQLIEYLCKSGRLQSLQVSLPSQEMLKCVIGSDVDDKKFYTTVSKEIILEDLYSHRTDSDFYKLKQLIMDFEDSELLIIYDTSPKRNENFLLCLDTFGKQLFLTGIAKMKYPKTMERFSSEVDVPSLYSNVVIQPRLEQHDDSVTEIETLHTIPKKAVIVTAIPTGERSQPVVLSDSKTTCFGFPSYEDNSFIAMRKTQDRATQCRTDLSEKVVQTHYAVDQSSWTQYEPRCMSDKEATRILESEEMKLFLKSAGPIMINALEDNVLFDLFEDKDKLETEDQISDSSDKKELHMSLYQFLQNQQLNIGKQVSCIVGHPNIEDLVAVSSCERMPEETASRQSMLVNVIVLWSLSEPFQPKVLLECPEDITSMDFLPTSCSVCCLVGGSTSGLIFLWDLTPHSQCLSTWSKDESLPPTDTTRWALYSKELASECLSLRPKELSNPEGGHSAAILKVFGINPDRQLLVQKSDVKSSFQLLTFGTNGEFILWEIDFKADVEWNIVLKAKVATKMSPDILFTSLCFNSLTKGAGDEMNKKILLGTEDGNLFKCFWDFDQEESDNASYSLDAVTIGQVHSGAVRDIQHSPFLHLLLTIGGAEIAIWDSNKDTILMVNRCNGNPTVGQWSPTRPSLFFIGTQDGTLEFWDILQDLSVPHHIQSVSDGRLTSLTFVSTILAVGDINGNVVFYKSPVADHFMTEDETKAVKACLNLDEQQQLLEPLTKLGLHLDEEDSDTKCLHDAQRYIKEYMNIEKQVLSLITGTS